ALMTNPAPGFKQRPDHRIQVKPTSVRVQVKFNGELIADSRDALVMQEGTYAPVYYVPRGDVKVERLARTSHRTHCPFKGDASYLRLFLIDLPAMSTSFSGARIISSHCDASSRADVAKGAMPL